MPALEEQRCSMGRHQRADTSYRMNLETCAVPWTVALPLPHPNEMCRGLSEPLGQQHNAREAD